MRRALEDIQRKGASIRTMTAKLATAPNEKARSGAQRGIDEIVKKKNAVSAGNSARWANMVRSKQRYHSTTELKILDLSYDDLYSGLQSVPPHTSFEGRGSRVCIAVLIGAATVR